MTASAEEDVGGELPRGLTQHKGPAAGSAGEVRTGKEVGPGSMPPVLTGRKMTRLCVTGLHVCRLPQLQAPTLAGWPNGTDDLAPPSARAAALGALGPVGGSRKRKHTCIGRETLKVGVG